MHKLCKFTYTSVEKETYKMLMKTGFFLLGCKGCAKTKSVDETKFVKHSTSLHEANIYSV